MSLLTLSLWRAPRYSRAMPHVPTNAERVRAFRAAAAPDALGNAYPWPWRSPHGSRRPPSSPAACASPPPTAAAPFDPDSLDVTSDNEPDLPWDGFEADPDMDIPEF